MTVADSCILAITCILFIIFVFVTRQVFKLVEYGDKRLMLMLFFLDLTILSKALCLRDNL